MDSSTPVTVTLIALLLAVVATTSTVQACSASDHAALLAFKSSLTEPYLGIFHTWTGTDCCSGWYGISCDPTTSRVADINLRGESEDPIFEKAGRSGYMTGSISPSICQLDRLTTLIIADWKGVSGSIPECITALSSLRILDLIGNKISGEIPSAIGNLQRLTVLNLADNQISGVIPPSLTKLASLKHLDISNNQISGNLPADFGNLKMLSRALLGKNQLTGSIPESVSGMYRLADLDLSMNRISGPVPAWLGSMPVLATLNLDSNMISGEIPGTLLGSTGLGILNLSRNAIEGTIPDSFGSKSYFMALDLSYNNLKGPIPKSLSSAAYIGHLDLSHNHLCGSIPLGSPFDHLEASSFSFNDCLCDGFPEQQEFFVSLSIAAVQSLSPQVASELYRHHHGCCRDARSLTSAWLSLVFSGTTYSRPHDTHEPTGEPESLYDKNDPKSFGNRAAHGHPPELNEKHQKSKRKKKEQDSLLSSDAPPARQSKRRRLCEESVLVAAEEGVYQPKTTESKAACVAILDFIKRQLGGKPSSIIVAAADEILTVIKNESLKTHDMEKEVEKLLNPIPGPDFDQLVSMPSDFSFSSATHATAASTAWL
ncbi:hypothetical protein Tsubulata_006182 [Turnera subulata]|uniref:Leucine-rich repeat-containing N-terminal plant-type domain-containing protein n=1 Tax=Turnera subulata TaxID=218843 RepID=A0A9Q0J4H7_9ROSI|nr:hypothetical protein Tsubulata_006182 [Turnera subulata]